MNLSIVPPSLELTLVYAPENKYSLHRIYMYNVYSSIIVHLMFKI